MRKTGFCFGAAFGGSTFGAPSAFGADAGSDEPPGDASFTSAMLGVRDVDVTVLQIKRLEPGKVPIETLERVLGAFTMLASLGPPFTWPKIEPLPS